MSTMEDSILKLPAVINLVGPRLIVKIFNKYKINFCKSELSLVFEEILTFKEARQH